jgi:glycolate oxidase FAD binding subunit
LADLVDAVRSHAKLIPIGAGTKPRLAETAKPYLRLSTVNLAGLVEYQPDEFTITALAGTKLSQLSAILKERGQYLPFDPLFAAAGSTVGGAVAANANGPGRFRFGGVRDFILEVQFIDGIGRVLRMGAKVVKNAAGFDLPKFFVGSAGRYGLLTEITFKVFPQPSATATLRLHAGSWSDAVQILVEAALGRWELDAVDIPPTSMAPCVRLAGPPGAVQSLAAEILGRCPGEMLSIADADALWLELRECSWRYPEGVLIKVALTPAHLEPLRRLIEGLDGGRMHVSAAGNLAFISVPTSDLVGPLDDHFKASRLAAMTLAGPAPLWLGACSRPQIVRAVKEALDPQHRFPGLDD